MRKIALLLVFALALPAWAQDKPPAQETEKKEPPKAEAPTPEAPQAAEKKPSARKKHSLRNEDARHCLDKPSNEEIIKCAEAYL
jgi:hypothetical protein